MGSGNENALAHNQCLQDSNVNFDGNHAFMCCSLKRVPLPFGPQVKRVCLWFNKD